LTDFRKRVKHARDFAVLYSLYKMAGALPWRAIAPWGRAVGKAAWHIAPVRKKVVLANLQAAFADQMGQAEIRDLAKRFYQELGVNLIEFCASRRLDRDGIRDLIHIENEDRLQQLREEGKGALLVSGHFGNFELLGAAVAARGFPVRFLIKTQSNPYLDRVQNELRRHAGVGVIRVGPSLKEMIRALRRGEFIGLLADQDAGPLGYFTPFLGRQASVFRGPAIYAHRFGCPLLTGFIFRQPDGTHRVRINTPHFTDPQWDEATAVARLTEAHTRDLEAAVRAAPESYFWVHRRWKTRPPVASA
jgi:KDO2-lipid IV(A) lauroyltransferase